MDGAQIGCKLGQYEGWELGLVDGICEGTVVGFVFG